MSSPNEIIHQSTRLRIIAALASIPSGDTLEFRELKVILETTDGNLGSHISTLENANYIKVKKDFVGKKPRTQVSLTHEGRKQFEAHVRFLRSVIDEGF